MKEKIILKSTDYIALKSGELIYSYPHDAQFSDGEKLNSLSEKELEIECQKRWLDFKRFPTPSNYSKLSLAQDLARAKGFDVCFDSKTLTEETSLNGQREY